MVVLQGQPLSASELPWMSHAPGQTFPASIQFLSNQAKYGQPLVLGSGLLGAPSWLLCPAGMLAFCLAISPFGPFPATVWARVSTPLSCPALAGRGATTAVSCSCGLAACASGPQSTQRQGHPLSAAPQALPRTVGTENLPLLWLSVGILSCTIRNGLRVLDTC